MQGLKLRDGVQLRQNSAMAPDFGLSYVRDFHDEEFIQIGEELRGHGLAVEIESSENQVYASLEWLIPTAVFLFVAEKYFGSILEEVAKDHYPLIRSAVKRIVLNVFRRVGAYQKVYAVPASKVSVTAFHIVSLYAKDRSGRLIKFLIDDQVSVDTSIDEIFALLEEYYGLPEPNQSLIDKMLRTVPLRRSDELVFKREPHGWRLCYPQQVTREKLEP